MTSSNLVSAQAPNEGLFFVNKIQTKNNQNSVQHLPQPININQKRNTTQNKYIGASSGHFQPPLKINDITPEKPLKQNQRATYLVGNQPTTTNNKPNPVPQVYYKVMHSTYQNYHRSSNSHLLASDLGISAKKLSPNQVPGHNSKKNVVLNDEIRGKSLLLIFIWKSENKEARTIVVKGLTTVSLPSDPNSITEPRLPMTSPLFSNYLKKSTKIICHMIQMITYSMMKLINNNSDC